MTESKQPKPHAVGLLRDFLAQQQQIIASCSLPMSGDGGEVPVKIGPALRRWRSTLHVFSRLFDPTRAEQLDAEIRWYAELLTNVADTQLLRPRLETMVVAVDSSLLMGPVRGRIEAELQTERDEHWRRLHTALAGDRYQALLGDLSSWVEQPPQAGESRQPPAALAELVVTAERELTRSIRRADTNGGALALTGVAVALDRAWDASDAAQAVKKLGGKRLQRYQKLRSHLAELHLSEISLDLLRTLGAQAGSTDGENGFAFGVLHEREEQKLRVAEQKVRNAGQRLA